MDINELINDILREWAWRLKDPTNYDFDNPEHMYHLREAMKELNLPTDFIDEYISNIATGKKSGFVSPDKIFTEQEDEDAEEKADQLEKDKEDAEQEKAGKEADKEQDKDDAELEKKHQDNAKEKEKEDAEIEKEKEDSESEEEAPTVAPTEKEPEPEKKDDDEEEKPKSGFNDDVTDDDIVKKGGKKYRKDMLTGPEKEELGIEDEDESEK